MSLLAIARRVLTGIGPISISKELPTGYTNMRNVGKLVQAILRAYERPEYRPKKNPAGEIIETYCNYAVRDVSGAMGCHDLENKSADQMYEFLMESKSWKEIPMGDAQLAANRGTLVVAALPSSEMEARHGHICIVRPGEEVHSAKFGGLVPAIMNIGGQNFILRYSTRDGTWIEAGINGAFRTLPKFFAWVDSL